MIQLENLSTEKQNPLTTEIDTLETLAMLQVINAEDKKVAPAIENILPEIAQAVDCITEQIRKGGRLFYLGAGTSGRLGILDAVECPPTFSTSPELVQGIIAGGYPAIFQAQEGAEDSTTSAESDLRERGLQAQDILVGIAASGRTPYVLGGLLYAKNLGTATIAISCSSDSEIATIADIALTAIVGPEVITGSTRLKAGTAQKMILNMLSTATMIRLGKVYGNLMVDVKTSNKKLEERARQIVMEATGCTRTEAVQVLEQAQGRAKLAIFLLISQEPLDIAKKLLAEANGNIRLAIEQAQKNPLR